MPKTEDQDLDLDCIDDVNPTGVVMMERILAQALGGMENTSAFQHHQVIQDHPPLVSTWARIHQENREDR